MVKDGGAGSGAAMTGLGSLRRRQPEPLERLAAGGLAVGRLAIGAGLWLAPRRSLRALGYADADGRALAVARIGATRDLVLGVWQLRSLGDRRELARATRAVAVADAGDALAFALVLRDPAAREMGLVGAAMAAPAAVAGAWLARQLES